MQKVKQALLDEYGSFADKRIKKLENGHLFIVDDRQKGGIASDGNPYGWFCTIFADVRGPDDVHVYFGGDVPDGATVQARAQATGVEWPGGFSVTKATIDRLIELARAVRAIVAPGAPWYDTASYKYSCPLTADSLERLARTLARGWSAG